MGNSRQKPPDPNPKLTNTSYTTQKQLQTMPVSTTLKVFAENLQSQSPKTKDLTDPKDLLPSGISSKNENANPKPNAYQT